MTAMRTAKLKRTAAAFLALLGWGALILQFVLAMQLSSRIGQPVPEALIRFFSYFTIEVNILAALVLTAFAVKASAQDWLVHPFVRSAVAVYIATVGLGYSALLRHLRPPEGAPWLADVLLHDVMPVAYLLFWLACVRKAGLRWYDPLLWLIYPLFYLGFALVRGKMSGFYPYPFIDAKTLGYAGVAVNTAGLLVACAAIGMVLVMIGWALSRRQPA